tara:strand:- start:1920 stop:2099 length:180 start_codon:yes stop_codon:yes gene_type:complete
MHNSTLSALEQLLDDLIGDNISSALLTTKQSDEQLNRYNQRNTVWGELDTLEQKHISLT